VFGRRRARAGCLPRFAQIGFSGGGAFTPVIRTALVLLLVSLLSYAQAPDREQTLRELLREGFEAFHQRNYPKAEPVFQKSLDLAVSIGNRFAEAEASRGLGTLCNARGNYARARAYLTKAIEILTPDLRHVADLARARNDLAYTEWATGNRDGAIKLYQEALVGFRAAGDKPEIAKVGYNLAFMTQPGAARLARIAESVEAANAVGNTRLAGKSTHLWGDTLYTLGQLRGALEKLNQALALLAKPEDRGDRARVLISLGRTYTAHMRYDAALGYYEAALAIHRELGEKQAIVYALNSIAATYRNLGDFAKASAAGREALVVARQTGSANLLAATLTNQARLHLAKGEHQTALELLRESSRLYAASMGLEFLYMAEAHAKLGQNAEAIESAGQAIQRATKLGGPHFLAQAHYWRSRALDADGRGAEALPDLRAALALTEKLRAQVVPTDFLKRGYAESWNSLMNFSVDLFSRQGLHEDALAAAEQGRARAFLDLLATRSLLDRVERAAAPESRGAAPPDGVEEPHIASFAAAPTSTVPGIRQAAEKSKSTLLIYWVAEKATFVWAISPTGEVAAARVPVGSARLNELVRRTAQASLRAKPAAAPLLLAKLRTRGGDSIPSTSGDLDAYRELYRLLLEPIAKHLPSPSSALTIVAHGPLHRLSFAGLKGPTGRYLIEDYAIGYVPSASLPVHAPAVAAENLSTGGCLFVADPVAMPAGPAGQPLPALPGARRETAVAARSFRGSRVTLLSGVDAGERAVRERLPDSRVVHFATHGFLIDEKPFDSFLALSRHSAAPADDGRLTVGEIYDLKLHADLVVLSACRTAGGPITGDGIVGMSRAFFYAGASRVLVTLWDVADVPTERLIARFYSHTSEGLGTREALRAAQLDLLAALRKGRVRVDTPLGSLVLPEHPVLWAGFVMLDRSL
jgi:CHAT domain-containing protein/tetratricopeptide (TPR) repeat protein